LTWRQDQSAVYIHGSVSVLEEAELAVRMSDHTLQCRWSARGPLSLRALHTAFKKSKQEQLYEMRKRDQPEWMRQRSYGS
jgi:hypothetical protein